MPATIADYSFISRTLGPGVLRAATQGRVRDVLVLLMTEHKDAMLTPEGALFGLALALRIRAASSSERFYDLLASKFGIHLAGRLPNVRRSESS